MHSGVIVPLITPVEETGAVSEPSVANLIASVRAHVNGLMPALTSGEGWLLTEEQWRDMLDYTVRHADGLPVLIGIQLPTTEQVINRAKLAQSMGADAVVVTTPFGPAVSQDDIYAHYQAIRAAVEVSLFVYNEKSLSGNAIELENLLRIFELPGVVGVKESSGSSEATRRVAAASTTVPVFEGWENLLIEVPGVSGFIGPLANLEPELCGRMLTDPTPARQEEINAACERYGILKPDWYRWVKHELRQRGVITTDRTIEETTAANPHA